MMKIQGLEFAKGSSTGNDSVYAAPQEWVWAAQGVGISGAYDNKGYPKRNDLFSLSAGRRGYTSPREIRADQGWTEFLEQAFRAEREMTA